MAPIYKHLFVLTYSHFCFNVGLPPSLSLTEQQYPVCYWSNIMIKGAVCRTKNRPAIQLCYPAVHCSRQVVSFFPPGRLGQVHIFDKRTKGKTLSTCLHDKSFLSVSSLLPLTGRNIKPCGNFGVPVHSFHKLKDSCSSLKLHQILIINTCETCCGILWDTAQHNSKQRCVCHAQSHKAGL